jgi:tRNA (adenine57-N1/adenine58-N1)-methyltransferase catalytic subunit
MMLNNDNLAQEGNTALLVSAQNKRYMLRLKMGDQLQTHRGVLNHADLIGLPWGSKVYSHLGSSYLLLQPSIADLLIEIRRNTQIMYPKDVGFVLVTLGIGPGKKVLEAGTGSGALTTALAFSVGPSGHVYSYDSRLEMQQLAQKNLERVGLAEQVTFKTRDIIDGFDENNIDALFLDVPNPYDYIIQARQALKLGGFFGSILPTTNQVSKLLIALHRENFAFIDVCEVLLRYYKAVPDRLRPTDRMVAHTGFLIFARSIQEGILPSEEDQVGSDDPVENIIEPDQ